ncbi:ABC transporter permease [Streptomyces sp. E11-3]|uniref:ABC transporter permease n=1 Tax=Streptomyces sp. E11-3 TaxID=3110112 RepID=UPI0039818721
MSSTRAEPRARFRDLVAAEWIKLWSLRSTFWVLGVGALVVLSINVNSADSNRRFQSKQTSPPDPDRMFDPMATAFVDPAYSILIIVAGSVGALFVFGEYTSGLIRTTFAAVPGRCAVMAAKVAVVAPVMLALGACVSAASFGVTQAVLREHGGLSIGDPGALRAVVASALLAPLSALVGMAIGAVLRHAASTVVGLVGVLLLLPMLLRGDRYRWVAELGNAMPVTAWEVLVRNPAVDYDLGRYPGSATEAWAVFAVWPLAAVVVVLAVVHRRDV